MKPLLLLPALLLAATLGAHAQDGARATLDKSSHYQEGITISNGTHAVESVFIHPGVKDKATADKNARAEALKHFLENLKAMQKNASGWLAT
jgi:hypothetical protein